MNTPSIAVCSSPDNGQYIFTTGEGVVWCHRVNGPPEMESDGLSVRKTSFSIDDVVALSTDTIFKGILRCYCLKRNGSVTIAINNSGGMSDWQLTELSSIPEYQED